MSKHQKQVGELRSLLALPDAKSWEKIYKKLVRWADPDELNEVIFPYCYQALERWPLHIIRLKPYCSPDTFSKVPARRFDHINWLCTDAQLNAQTNLERFWQAPPLWSSVRLEKTLSAPQLQQLIELGLPHLTELTLSSDLLTSQHIAQLPSLNALFLRDCALTTEQVEHMLQWPVYDQLQRIGINSYFILAEGAAPPSAEHWLTQILHHRALPQLRSLSLKDYRPLSPALLSALLEAPCTANLRELNLAGCYMENSCLEVLIQAPYLERIEQLDLRYNWSLDRELIDRLQQASWLTQAIEGPSYDNIWE